MDDPSVHLQGTTTEQLIRVACASLQVSFFNPSVQFYPNPELHNITCLRVCSHLFDVQFLSSLTSSFWSYIYAPVIKKIHAAENGRCIKAPPNKNCSITSIHTKEPTFCPEEGKRFLSCCRLSFICIVVLIWRLILLPVMKIKELKNNLWNIVKGLRCTVLQIFNTE